MLIVDRGARIIKGRAVRFDTIGVAKLALPRRFPFGCLTWHEWPPLVIEHDNALRVGKVVAFDQLDDGLWVTMRAAHGERGDRALAMAVLPNCGLSIHIEDQESIITPDGVLEYISARVTEVTLTRNPVFP